MQTTSDVFGLSMSKGFQLPAARLWLDGKARGELAYVAELGKRTVRHGRLLCAPELVRLWGQAPKAPLTPPMGQRFRLGPFHLQLMPAGSTPGASLLSIEGQDRDVLVATCARLDTLPLATPMQPFDADVLVVNSQLAGFEHASVAKLTEEVGGAIDEVRNGLRGVVWLLDDPMVAMAVASLVGERAPLYGSLGFKRWQQRYVAAGLSVPRIRRMGASAQPGAFVLWPVDRAKDLHGRDVDDFTWTLAAQLADHVRADQVGAERALPISRHAAGQELEQLVVTTGAKDVVALGDQAGVLAQRLAANPDVAGDVGVWHLSDKRQLSMWR